MKLFAVFLMFAFVTMPFDVAAEELTGRQIFEETERRHDRPYEYEEQIMVLVNADKSKEKRVVKRYKRDVKGGANSLMVFHSPAGVKGTAILTWQHDETDDDQWIYLPAMGKKLKRIAKGGKRNYFMGTDYTYEDLASESSDKFAFERLADEKIGDIDHFVILQTPVDETIKEESGYSSRKIWIRKDIFFSVRVDFTDRKGKLIKRQTLLKLQNVEGDTWRSNKRIMKNLAQKHITATKVTKRSFDEKDVAENVFTSRFITSGRHIR